MARILQLMLTSLTGVKNMGILRYLEEGHARGRMVITV
jgi:hypothetical protein